jgi:multicomponent Na+:H+ antiporter subunit C
VNHLFQVPLFGLCGAALVGVGLFGAIVLADIFRRILSLIVMGSGIFLLFSVVARRPAAGGLAADPVPQALLITGIVVAFSAVALAVMLLERLDQVSRTDEGEE